MVLSANIWRAPTAWEIEIVLTTSPTTLTVTDEYGSFSVPFSLVDGVLKTSITVRSAEFSVKLDTETKVLKFTDEGDIFALEGDTLIPSIQGDYLSVWIPVSDFLGMSVKFYDVNGSLLEVQGRDKTPFWGVRYPPVNHLINGKNVPCLRVDLTYRGGTAYLVSAATNTWEGIWLKPFRCVISGLNNSLFSESRSKRIVPEAVSGKTYYADFN